MKFINKGTFTGLTNIKTTIPRAFKMVFSIPIYIAISAAIFTAFWIIFNVFDQLLFFPLS
jgi:hypothetical protein